MSVGRSAARSRWSLDKALAVIVSALTVPAVALGAVVPAGAQTAGNTITLSKSVASVGEVVTVSGHEAAECASRSLTLSFLTASGTTPGPGFNPPGAYPVQLLFPTSAPGGSWTYDFAVPAYLAASGVSGVAVTPGTYTFTASCSGAPAASATLTVTSAYSPGRFVSIAPSPDGRGYWMAQAGGGVYAYGDARFFGSLPGLGIDPPAPIVGMAATPDGRGYWLVGADGGVYAFGDAQFFGSLPGLGVTPSGPIVGMAATSDGGGYWLLGADGGVFAFGDAPFLGAAGEGLGSEPFSAISAVPGPESSSGYVVASEYDDIVVAFTPGRSQTFSGPSLGAGTAAPFIGVAPAGIGTASVWTAEVSGGVFSYSSSSGTPGFYGSLPSLEITPAAPVSAIASTPDHHGYWLLGSNGAVFAFGDAPYLG